MSFKLLQYIITHKEVIELPLNLMRQEGIIELGCVGLW